MKNVLSFSLLIGLLIIVCCSKDPVEILYGSWNLTEVEAESTVTGEISKVTGTGSITFNDDGTGMLDYSFSVLGISTSTSGSFNYSANENTITLNPGQNDALTFSRIENKKKKQVLEFDQDAGVDQLKIRLTFEM